MSGNISNPSTQYLYKFSYKKSLVRNKGNNMSQGKAANKISQLYGKERKGTTIAENATMIVIKILNDFSDKRSTKLFSLKVKPSSFSSLPMTIRFRKANKKRYKQNTYISIDQILDTLHQAMVILST